jgi:hypothetical protein
MTSPANEIHIFLQPRSQGLSFCHLGETLAAAGHVPPRFWEVNLIVTVRGVGKERVCSVLKLQLWVMKFTVNLQQEIVKRTLKLIMIDHIITNMPNRITYTSVLPCPTISDHDAPYACVNIRVTRFQPRFKMIRDEKHFDNKAFIDDFSTLPFSVIYSTDDPDDKLYLFNSLFNLQHHGSILKTYVNSRLKEIN